MKILKFIIWLTIVFSAGCSQRHYIAINPHVPVTPHNFSKPKPVGLKVIDARSGNKIAQWRGDFYIRKFTVSPDSDITDVMRQKISEGLFRIGFQPKRMEKMPTKTLRVEIVQLKSRYKQNLPVMSVKIQSILQARCKNEGKSYTGTYSDKKELNSAPASTFPNENLINDSLSDTLRKMFKDKKLISCLAE